MLMETKEKLTLLKSLDFLSKIPDDDLADLAGFLDPVAVSDNQIIFNEGDKGDSLFFISKGQIRIEKMADVETGSYKALAILHSGDCFGEMSFVDGKPRSARATAARDSLLFKLDCHHLIEWLHSQPDSAMIFFTELVQLLSKRLRRTSSELTLLFDLASLFLLPFADSAELLVNVLKHIVHHIEGRWSAVAFLYNEYNMEMDKVAMEGDFDESTIQEIIPNLEEHKNFWINTNTYYVSFPVKIRPMGYMIFHTEAKLNEEEKTEIGRTISTTAILTTSALENMQFKAEAIMRDRLKSSTYGISL